MCVVVRSEVPILPPIDDSSGGPSGFNVLISLLCTPPRCVPAREPPRASDAAVEGFRFPVKREGRWFGVSQPAKAGKRRRGCCAHRLCRKQTCTRTQWLLRSVTPRQLVSRPSARRAPARPSKAVASDLSAARANLTNVRRRSPASPPRPAPRAPPAPAL
eukprot:359853-Chlamydomonas_euryale.AAC.13